MNLDDKKAELKRLKASLFDLKREIEYLNSLQLAVKLILNGSYGAFATEYFILYNNNVAKTITAHGRDLTQTMDRVNREYWYDLFHLDTDLHKKLNIDNVTKINESEPVSIYCDTDSVFVSFKPAIDHCNWKNRLFNDTYLNSLESKFLILSNSYKNKSVKIVKNIEELKSFEGEYETLIVDGSFVKNWDFKKLIKSDLSSKEIIYNWNEEIDFIHGLDEFRIAGYFVDCLEKYAAGFGVENKADFELEKIAESVINIAKKKYIMNIIYEDGIPFEPLSYVFPKGVDLVRSSTPAFARDKIVSIVKYLFTHPDTFNIKDLLKLIKQLRKEFELADIEDISMQTSVSKYNEKVIDDEQTPLKFVTGAHFAVKASAYYNYMLKKNKLAQSKYEFIKSGTKIKYYVCKDKTYNEKFAYIRGSYPIEMNPPEIDMDTQFEKAILSPVNSIITKLNMPEITRRLSVVMNIFGD